MFDEYATTICFPRGGGGEAAVALSAGGWGVASTAGGREGWHDATARPTAMPASATRPRHP